MHACMQTSFSVAINPSHTLALALPPDQPPSVLFKRFECGTFFVTLFLSLPGISDSWCLAGLWLPEV